MPLGPSGRKCQSRTVSNACPRVVYHNPRGSYAPPRHSPPRIVCNNNENFRALRVARCRGVALVVKTGIAKSRNRNRGFAKLKSRNREIAKSRNREIAKSRNREIAKSRNREIAKSRNREIAKLIIPGTWQHLIGVKRIRKSQNHKIRNGSIVGLERWFEDEIEF